MPNLYTLLRTARRISAGLLNAAFGNLPEAYYESRCNAIKAGIYVQ